MKGCDKYPDDRYAHSSEEKGGVETSNAPKPSGGSDAPKPKRAGKGSDN